MSRLAPPAREALIDFMSASQRFCEMRDRAASVPGDGGLTDNPFYPAMHLAALDAEQALLAIFTATFGEPTINYPDDAA